MKIGEELREYAFAETVYVDGLAGVIQKGEFYEMNWYKNVPLKFENGLLVQDRMPILRLIRPVKSVLCGDECRFWKAGIIGRVAA